jgi:phosphohistidine swiveling domain-containing protein
MTVVAEHTFTPPRAGVWFLDPTHFTRPATRFHAELFPERMIAGFSEGLRRYGSLLEYLDLAFINGFFYYCPRPVGAPEDAVGYPPREVWEEISGRNPEIRERLETSSTLFERRLWREDLDRWDREVKPAAIREHLELLGVDPVSLETNDLLTYLDRCRENMRRGTYLHHLFNVPALLPVGDLLAHTQEWTDRSGAEILGLLQGASPDPLGADDELAGLIAFMDADPEACAVLDSAGEPGDVLAALRSLPGEVGEAAEAYVNRVGYRPVNGEDIGEPSVIELPELILGAIRAGLESAESSVAEEHVVERTAAIRDAVPAKQRAAFDELLGEAKLMYRLRDERGTFADLWAIGIMRRAILEAGRRLAAQGLIAEASHLVEADYAEMRTLIDGGAGVTGEELAVRARYRLEARYNDAPAVLGGEPGEPLPAEWLPPAAARLEQALGVAVQEIFAAPPPQTEARKVRGLGVSPGTYEGTARVVRGTSEFGRIQHGDVLVTNSTTTAFNIVLPLLGAVVTDRGGLLSHAAIVAREYGIPGVVGCTDATAVLPDGVRVRVNGSAGEVEVLP